MKSILKLSTVAGLLFAMNAGMAKEPRMKFITDGDSKDLIFEMDTQFNSTDVKFLDEQDHVLFYEKPSEGVYIKRFNITALKDGYYYIIAENALKSYVYELEIAKNEMEIVKKEEKQKPVFRKDGEKLSLNLLNLDNNTVDIKVYDSNNRIVFKEVVEDELVVGKSFNFEEAFADRYRVVVRDGKEVYYEYIVIN